MAEREHRHPAPPAADTSGCTDHSDAGVAKPAGCVSVLVADDEPAIRDLLTTVLAGMGIGRIDSAQNGLEACELCLGNEYDIIFLDVSMPVLSGVDAYRRIREARPSTRVVFITGLYQDEELIEKIGGERTCGYIRKPFNIADIRSIVSCVVRAGIT
ncbi:MAG TPA: response regulator [Spirochaetota bacterium]|nr:response regulator [Spirochaetota bacterium]